MLDETNTKTEGAEDEAFTRNDNFLKDCAAVIMERYEKATSASRTSLEDLRVVGERLNDAKEALSGVKGGFGKWIEKCGFPFDKSWRARLMKLAANWEEIIAAIEALPEAERKWSVDAALAIWNRAKKKAEAPEGSDEGEGTGGSSGRTKKESEAARLRRELAEALAEVERLRMENARLRGRTDGNSRRKGTEEAPKDEPKIDARTRKRVEMVYALYKAGGTQGEKDAAKSRLQAIADKHKITFDDLLKVCGLEP